MFKYIEMKGSSIITVQNVKWSFAASNIRRARRRGKIVTIWNQDHQHLFVFSKYLVFRHSLTTNFRPIYMSKVKCTTREGDCLFSEVFEILLKLVLLSCVMCPLQLNIALHMNLMAAIYRTFCLYISWLMDKVKWITCKMRIWWRVGLHPWPAIKLNIERNYPWW